MSDIDSHGKELGVPIEEATLDNLCGGDLRDQFLADVQSVIGVFSTPGEWQETGKFVKAKVSLDVEFMLHIESGAIIASTSSAFKPPKRKKAASQVYTKHGVLLTERAHQTTIEDFAKVTKLEGRAGNDDE